MRAGREATHGPIPRHVGHVDGPREKGTRSVRTRDPMHGLRLYHRRGQYVPELNPRPNPYPNPSPNPCPYPNQVLKAAEAAFKPAGDGRSAPNSHPRLATPLRQGKLLNPDFCRCM